MFLRGDTMHVNMDIFRDPFVKDEIDRSNMFFDMLGNETNSCGIGGRQSERRLPSILECGNVQELVSRHRIRNDDIAAATTTDRATTRLYEFHSIACIAIVTAENDRHELPFQPCWGL